MRSLTLLVVALGVLGSAEPSRAKRKPPSCPGGRFVVQGDALVAGGTARDTDAVVIETAVTLEAAGPQVLIRSGCPESAVRLIGTRKGTKVSAKLAGCVGLRGKARLKARIHPGCRKMTGKLKARRKKARKFTAALVGDFDGRVFGTVTAVHGAALAPLPGATVFLKDRASGAASPRNAVTDVTGLFRLPPHPIGNYDVCVEAAGFAPTCHDEPVDISPASGDRSREIRVVPSSGAVHGRVLLADGGVCLRQTPASGVPVHTVVSLVGADTRATANSRGHYVLSGIPAAGAYTVRAVCAGVALEQPVTIGSEELTGARAVDLTLPNSAPTLLGLEARDATGVVARTALPGSILSMTAQVQDADGDTLHFIWRDGSDRVVSVDAASIQWPLLDVPARNLLNVEVTDGKGGFAEGQIAIPTSPTGQRFIGTVTDASGSLLADAAVAIDGTNVPVDSAGAFRVTMPERERHVLTVKRPGFALMSKVFYGGAPGLELRLEPARRFPVDPSADIDVQDGPKGATVHIDANSLVDEQGHPPTGPLQIDLHTYDHARGGLPGDRRGIDRLSTAVTLQTVGAMSVDITDASGKRYVLGPGRMARISMKAPARPVLELPRTIALSRYDDVAGLWIEQGRATRDGDRYEGTVAGFSAWQVWTPGGGSACLRVDVDVNRLELPFHLSVSEVGIFGTETAIHDFPVTEKVNVIYNLPEGAFVRLAVSPQSNPANILGFVTVNAGPAVSPAYPPFPYAPCQQVTLGGFLPATEWLTMLGFGTNAGAEAYYQSIGARPAKDTFQKWWDANGFQTGDSANDVVFFNPNELGLGRRANCKLRDLEHQPKVGCYVTKYGHVGGSPTEALDDTIDELSPGDTVAMEFGPAGSSVERVVKFYIYGPDGALKTHTAFDTQGSIKHVPNVCLHCHGAGTRLTDNLGNLANDGGDVGAKFVAFDPRAYTYPPSGPYTLANQQERFRELNAMIAYAFKHQGPGMKLIESIYPSPGVHTPGTQAIEEPVPGILGEYNGWRGHEDGWRRVIKPACRTCHMWHASGLSFSNFAASPLSVAMARICDGLMPNAIAPMLKLWRTSDPHLPDLFADVTGTDRCDSNARPTVQIVAPADGATISPGGLNFVTLKATTSDAEDGDGCCKVTWTSLFGGTLGYGHELDYIFDGFDHVTATAYDSNGAPSLPAKITLFPVNDPPQVQIVPASGQVFYRNLPYKLFGSASDPNEQFLTVPCSGLAWKSSKAGDPSPAGCQPEVTFTSNGARTITLTATDSDGATASTSRAITVTNAPPNSPPSVIIKKPDDNVVVNPFVPLLVQGSATDPDGTAQPTYLWRVRVGASETTIGTTPSFTWTPDDDVAAACGLQEVELRLYATDPDGTTPRAVTLFLAYGPC